MPPSLSDPGGDGSTAAGVARAQFRRVLGHVPTSVVAVTAMGADGVPHGMTVGSFTSVSLDPPLVGFLPARASTTFPRIRAAGRFCVNVLATDQRDACHAFAAAAADRFAELDWFPGPRGTPRLNGAIAWIDCVLKDVIDAGDHHFVLAEVAALEASARESTADSSPLIFFRGSYGGFMPLPG
jgi:flavin reductase (DIM6/NTAB) family NADH-FMN oxidoreductase RutF